VWSPRVVCARDGIVARSSMMLWWLADGKVWPESASGAPRVAPDKMAEGGAHPRGGSTVGCDGGSSTTTSKAVEALR
jgi:hypothetical protein